MLSACVAFIVKTNALRLRHVKECRRFLPAGKTVSAARMAAAWSPRPGLAIVRMARTTARATSGGFWSDVAALSSEITAAPPGIPR